EVSYDRPVRVMTVYSAGFAAVYTSFALLYRHAYRMREELQLDPLEQHVTRQHRSEKQIVAAFGAASVAVSLSDYVLPVEWATPQSAAGWMYFAIGPLLATHAILWQRARERRRVDIAAVGSAAAQSTWRSTPTAAPSGAVIASVRPSTPVRPGAAWSSMWSAISAAAPARSAWRAEPASNARNAVNPASAIANAATT